MKDMTMNIEFHIQTDDDITREEIHATLERMIENKILFETKYFTVTRREYNVTEDK